MSASFDYRPGLTHLRGLSVTLVVLFHAGVVETGYVGVDVFFVLSGFLIANILWTDLHGEHSTGRVLSRFYARRCRRLLPLSLLVLVLSAAAARLWFRTLADDWGDAARAAVIWAENWYLIRQSNDYFAAEGTNPFQHYWSLGVEEQFYVALPLLLVALVAATRRWPESRRLVAVAATAGVLILGALGSWFVVEQSVSEFYYSTFTRSYQLMAGVAAMAVTRRSGLSGDNVVLALTGTSGIIVIGILLDPPVVLAGAATTAFAVCCVLASRVVLFAWPPLEWLGNWSYGIYLWHFAISEYLTHERLGWDPWEVFVVTMAGAVALSAVSYRVFETPIRRLDVPDAWTFAATALAIVGCWFAVGALSGGGGSGPGTDTDERPTEDGPPLVVDDDGSVVAAAPAEERVATSDLLTLPEGIDLQTTAVGRCGHVDATTSCVDVDGEPMILLLGDSFANQIYQALRPLAEERGWGLAAYTRPGCPWMLDAYNAFANEYTDLCIDDKPVFEEVFTNLEPDVVVVHSYPYQDSDPLTSVTSGRGLGSDGVERAVNETIDWFSEHGARTVFIGPSPVPADEDVSMPACLTIADWADQCSFTSVAMDTAMQRAVQERALRDPHVWYQSTADQFCDEEQCPAALGNVALFADARHLSGGVWYLIRERVAGPIGEAVAVR